MANEDELKTEIATLKRENEILAEGVTLLNKTLVKLMNFRSYREPCSDISVGSFVSGGQVFGQVTWVGNGGGIWKGQELCRVRGHGLVATHKLQVVDVQYKFSKRPRYSLERAWKTLSAALSIPFWKRRG